MQATMLQELQVTRKITRKAISMIQVELHSQQAFDDCIGRCGISVLRNVLWAVQATPTVMTAKNRKLVADRWYNCKSDNASLAAYCNLILQRAGVIEDGNLAMKKIFKHLVPVALQGQVDSEREKISIKVLQLERISHLCEKVLDYISDNNMVFLVEYLAVRNSSLEGTTLMDPGMEFIIAGISSLSGSKAIMGKLSGFSGEKKKKKEKKSKKAQKSSAAASQDVGDQLPDKKQKIQEDFDVEMTESSLGTPRFAWQLFANQIHDLGDVNKTRHYSSMVMSSNHFGVFFCEVVQQHISISLFDSMWSMTLDFKTTITQSFLEKAIEDNWTGEHHNHSLDWQRQLISWQKNRCSFFSVWAIDLLKRGIILTTENGPTKEDMADMVYQLQAYKIMSFTSLKTFKLKIKKVEITNKKKTKKNLQIKKKLKN